MSPYKRTDDHWHRKRAQKYGVANVHIRPRDIFERDGWRCHVCGKFVRRYGDSEHPMAATLDHVVPISEGGTHTPGNIRTAHRCCNIQRDIERRKGMRRWKKRWGLIGGYGWRQSIRALCSNYATALVGNDCY